MRIPPLATAVAAGIMVMWAALLALQYAAPCLPPLPVLGWTAPAASTTLAVMPALIAAAKVYKRIPPIRVEAERPIPDGAQGTDVP